MPLGFTPSEFFNRVVLGLVAEATAESRAIVPGKVSEVANTANGERIVHFAPGIGDRQDGEQVSDGIVPSRPVLYPGGGGWSDRWPLDEGDEGLGLAVDRNPHRWEANRTAGQAHSLDRPHDVSNVQILPVTMIAPSGPSDVGEDRVISNARGEVIRLGLGAVTISTPGPDPTVVATIEIEAGGSVSITVAAGKFVNIGGPTAAAIALGQKTIDSVDTMLAFGVPVANDGGANLLATMTTGWNGVKAAILAAKGRAE